MTDQSGEAILYDQITLAVHVDLAAERVHRVVEPLILRRSGGDATTNVQQ